jgi:predicted polyphosphate/ATP-dependent NAD kinase
LKGTDGIETIHEALKRGATPVASRRAIETLQGLRPYRGSIEIYTCSGEMGEREAQACGFIAVVVTEAPQVTTADHTKATAKMLAEKTVDLLLFAGGDGTARDILDAIDSKIPVLGIPAGVKMHSSVFATNPSNAARIIIRYIQGEIPIEQGEVMDVDEGEFKAGRLSAKLYGYMKVPYEPQFIQRIKTATIQTDDEVEQQCAIAKYVKEEMKQNELYVLGPGTTVKAIADVLGTEKTLLGVDVIYDAHLVAKDVDERRLLELIQGRPVKIVVTPIGGQAYIFGRGNQQISPEVIKSVGKENIIVVATRDKLQRLSQKRLLVDTGDKELDEQLRGYIRVVTDYREETVMKVE